MSATTDQPAKRRLRTWSAFGDIKRRPSDYEIGTQGMNYTLREGRKAPFEQNPSSPANLWMQTYRDDSPLQVDDWESFRDPDMLSYRAYVTQQHEQETKVGGVLEQYAAANADAQLPPEWRATLARPRTRKVNARLAVVFPIAVSSSAIKLAICPPSGGCRTQ